MSQDTTATQKASNDETIADADLVLRTRSGDAAAFGELWRRHYPSGMSVARSITSSIDPDDLVQESYTRIYQAIIKGGGPNGSFRAYLFTSIRNTAAAWGRSRRESAIDELDTVADPDSTEQATNEALDRSLTAQAFRSLPSRWQEVLWYTEIEQMKPAEAGPLLGMKAGAVSQLAFRAREGLREAWIQAHLRSAEPGSDCQWTIEHLGAYSRGNLGVRDRKRLDAHLEDCARCMIVAAEAKDVSTRLALVLLPLVLGVTGATGYLATLQGGGAPVVALAAMPSAVTEGAVTVGSGAVAAGSSAGAGAGGAGGGAGAGGTGGAGAAGGGVLSGVGALVGAGSAALIVAGVVTAATIVPGLVGANPAASLPSAGDSDSSSISADVGPDEAMAADEPVAVETPAPEPVIPPVEAPVTPEPAEDQAPTTAPASAAPVAPVAPPVTAPGDEEPETEEPGSGDPGTEEPGTEEPGSPVVPTAPVEFGAADICLDDDLVTHVSVGVLGTAGTEVDALLDGGSGGADGTQLGASGAGTISLRPSLTQIILGSTVEVHYVTLDGPVLPSRTTLDGLGVTLDAVLLAPACGLPADVPADAEVPTEATPPTDAATTPAPVVEPAQAPAEQAPAEQAPTEQAPQAPAEQAPQAPAEQAPVESAPTESETAAGVDAPIQDPLVDETAEPALPLP
ncbi:sigma-70 family RNA polymerase sigma factor [Microbacterium sp. SZ1]|uniref:sigma-70 family RNA polymerase sigma factor n=1 Tax=Microbacterium sp. SZ1 TaxID=1849736 RepID=UPI0015C7B9B9|nr:sigma-70 family RNA polymerase sigma factor [Microbacterium sp. SZ1]